MILGHYYNLLSLHSLLYGTTPREEGGLIISFEEWEILDRKKERKQLSFSIKNNGSRMNINNLRDSEEMDVQEQNIQLG